MPKVVKGMFKRDKQLKKSSKNAIATYSLNYFGMSKRICRDLGL